MRGVCEMSGDPWAVDDVIWSLKFMLVIGELKLRCLHADRIALRKLLTTVRLVLQGFPYWPTGA